MGQGTASGAMNLRSTHGPSSRLSPLRPRVEATELCERAPRTDRPDRPAKVLPEPNEEFIDQTLQVPPVRMCNRLRRVVLCEQLLRRLLGHFVPGPLGQNRGDQDEERVLPFCDDLCESCLPLA